MFYFSKGRRRRAVLHIKDLLVKSFKGSIPGSERRLCIAENLVNRLIIKLILHRSLHDPQIVIPCLGVNCNMFVMYVYS